MQALKGKVAFITGASKGIGLATAERFAKEGCNLVLSARSEILLEEISNKIENLYKVKAISIAGDLTNSDNIEKPLKFSKKILTKLTFS